MLTDLEITLLSVIAAAPSTRTDVERHIEQRSLRHWLLIGSSSVPLVLQKLEAYQLIQQDHARGDTVYQITEGGRGVLQTAMTELLRQPIGLGERFELALANLEVLTPAQVYQAVTQRSFALQSKLNRLRSRLAECTNDTQRLLIAHSITLAEAELMWVSDFLGHWASRYPAVSLEPAPAEKQPMNEAATKTHKSTDAKNPGKQLQYIHLPPEE
ncbi:MAG: hypothetical protein IAE89_10070 [Anaerolineae bacterium]|nr:hypothetical protein [Anaerolineae bacterium]